jgi:hypothetical protein
LRQAFSVRLAKLSSRCRRTDGYDPAAKLAAPPDWHAVRQGDFYAEAARLCRFLELADPHKIRTADPATLDIDPVAARLSELSAVERKLAQVALVNLLGAGARLRNSTTWDALLLLIRLHPTRSLNLLWRLRSSAASRAATLSNRSVTL